uniref:Uncharacterized protein n=1 Tax=Fagus sylvatica TaxID=28930 RepID=A0A2N9FM24_FAGSY
MAEEASKLRGLEARVAALETKFNFLLQFIRRWTEREEEKKKATISKRQKEIYPALSLSKAAQTLPTPRRPAFHIPRPSRTEPRQFQPLPIPVPQLYTLLIKKKMITPVKPEDAYRATAQRLQQRPDLSEGYSTAPRAPKESTEAGTCQYHPGARDHNLQGCEEFKKEVAGLITKGLIRRRGEQPERDCMTIDQLRLSPYEKTNFQARMERIEEDFEEILKPKTEEEVVGNLTSGLGGITRSGRCYTPEELEKRRKEAGKAVEDPTKTKASRGRGRRFPPNHQEKALLKVLNEAYVPEDITGPSFENMVTSILVTNQLTFSDDELPPEGRGHTKALYISVKTNDRIVSRVLIDNGSALNVCPLSTLEKLDIDPTRVRVNSMVVRAFDGTRREVLGEIDLPGDHGYIQPEQYPSSLHQKMKLIIGNQLVTILAEEPISIYNDGEIPYIDGCAPEEASFHSFEFVTVIHRVAAVEPRLSKAGIMVAKEFVKAGFQPGQGLGYANQGRTTIVTLEGNKDRYGLGYTPTRRDRQMAYEARRQRAAAKLRGEKWPERKMVIPHIRTTFPASAMFQVDEGDEETLDEDTWEDDDLPDLLPHLMVPHGLETLEFEIFCEHGDPESHLRKYREKMALHTNNEFLMISTFHESLPECAVTWFYQLKNITCWKDSGKSFPGPIPMQPPDSTTIAEEEHQGTTAKQSSPPPVAEEEYAGPMVEGLSIHTIHRGGGFHHHTTDPPLPTGRRKPRRGLAYHCYSVSQVAMKPREVKIGTRCAAEQKEALIALLREFHEIFAWSYQDMPGLDTDIVVHKIPLKPECKPVKQALRRMKPEVILKIKEEVEKQLKAGFLSTVTYSDWVANIVPVPKKDGKVRMCVDYRDLNRASPKDNFPLPHIDTLVDNTATNVVFSFMDGFSGYNQIKMAEEDKSKTAFVTHWGTFVYDVMPFGLKNAGATYQRAMVTLFHDMIHHEIEVYVDDMIAKSRTAQDHLTDLRKLFQRLKKYQLRLNPNKCAFGVTSGKLLGFIVSGRGIEIDPAKTARRAFDKIKEYLLNPPILVPPTPGRPLILYLTVQEASMGCMLGQQDETGKKEQAIYYLSKKFTEPETRYLLVEKTCCALAWASKKLRQYMLYYTTWLVSRNGPDQAIKGQAIADYLADYPSEQLELMDSRVPRRRPNAVGSGIGAVLVSPKGQQTPIAVKLGFDCTNNMTEYEACIVGLQAALEFGAYELEVFGDSLLIVSQTNGEWQARDPKLIPYQRYISRLVPKFKYVTFTYTPRAHNHFADALATLASLIKLVEGDDVRPLRIETRDIPAYCVCIEECMNVEAEIDDKPWYYDIKRFIQDREFCTNGTHDATLLRCVDAEEANRLIQEMHAGLMGAHANGPFLARKIMRAGYYWLTMERDCIRHVQTCHKCQMYQNSKNAPPQYLHTMASPWPFSAWGMDVIGAITPKASNGHEFILVAIDYFTKWVEACSFKNVTQVAVTRFVKNNIICRYGMPEMLITDNASNLNNRMMDQLCQQFKIQHHNSAPYRPKMNGAVEAANKNVKKILSKMTETYKDWHEHLPYAFVWKKPNGPKPRYEQLNFIDEKRLAALCHGQLYQRRIERAYNKKARPRTFQPGDLVLKKRNMALSDPRGKFAPSYEGPYVVKKAFSGGAIILADMDGEEFRSPINSDSVIKYHV